MVMDRSSNSVLLRVRPHSGQRAVLESRAFCTAAIAGTGGGKTVVGKVWLLLSMVARPGQVWVVAEPTWDMVERVLLTSSPGSPSLIELLGYLDPRAVFLRSKGLYRHRLGTVILASADRPESLQGAHVAGVWLDEAGLMRMEAWLVALQRVGFAGGRLLLTTTPYNLGWLKSAVFDAWRGGDKDFNVVQFPSTANPEFPVESLERARRSMSESRFRMLYYGEFGRPEGMVYDCFSASEHVVAPFEIPGDWFRVGGLDFGYNHPTAGVFLARDGDGVWYWHAEHKRREWTLEANGKALLAGGGRGFTWYRDPAAPQQGAELRRLGLEVVAGNNAVLPGIDTVYSLLKNGRLKVFSTCIQGIDELESYCWERVEDGFTDRPVKLGDDLMDALRYALHSVEKGGELRLFT